MAIPAGATTIQVESTEGFAVGGAGVASVALSPLGPSVHGQEPQANGQANQAGVGLSPPLRRHVRSSCPTLSRTQSQSCVGSLPSYHDTLSTHGAGRSQSPQLSLQTSQAFRPSTF